MEERKTLEAAEQEVRVETRTREANTLQAIHRMIDLYLAGFGEIGTSNKKNDNRLEQVWFLLTLRSFKTMRMSYLMLEAGYYGQSLILSRSAAEDWLFCTDSIEHEETVRFLLDREVVFPESAQWRNGWSRTSEMHG